MDGLEKILDKLGVFNILAVFVPGLVIGTDVLLFHRIINVGAFPESGFVFVIVSFVLGIVFYEIGYTFFTFFRRQDKILYNVIERKDKWQRSPHLKLCDYEYEKVKEHININSKQPTDYKKCDINDHSSVNLDGYRVYNYCKYRVREHRNNNSIVAMSRTLFAYFFLVTLLAIILAICYSCSGACSSCPLWIFAGVHFALSIIFLIRTIRNYELMYATVIKEFYQSII